jgi:hypothetical protein
VADCLTRQFEDLPVQLFSGLVLQHLPAAFQSLREHQIKDAFCRQVYEKVKQKDPAVRNLRLLNDTSFISLRGRSLRGIWSPKT